MSFVISLHLNRAVERAATTSAAGLPRVPRAISTRGCKVTTLPAIIAADVMDLRVGALQVIRYGRRPRSNGRKVTTSKIRTEEVQDDAVVGVL